MRRQLALLVTVVALSAISAFAIPATLALQSLQRHASALELEQEAFIAAATLGSTEPLVITSMQPVDSDEPHLLALYAPNGTLIDGDGPAYAEPEILAALSGEVSHGTNGDEYIAAIPLAGSGSPRAALRVSEPIGDAQVVLHRQLLLLGALGLTVFALAVAAGAFLSARLSRPMIALRRAASSLGNGEAMILPQSSGIAEIDELSQALSQSSARVEQVIDRERAFAAYVAHHLRTPLAAALIVTETELTAPRSEPALALREVLTTLERLDTTADQLLSLSLGPPPSA